jgi:hypothetical protein
MAEPDTIWTRYISGIESARFSPDGSKIVVTQEYSLGLGIARVYILDANTGEEELKIEVPNYVFDGFLTNDNSYLYDRSGLAINLNTSETFETNPYYGMDYNTENGLFYGVRFDIESLPMGEEKVINPRLEIFDVISKEVSLTYPINDILLPKEILISNDNRWLVVSGKLYSGSSGNERSLQLFELIDGSPQFRKEIYRGAILGKFQFNSNSNLLVVQMGTGEPGYSKKVSYNLNNQTIEKEFDFEEKYSSYAFYENLIFWSSYPDFTFAISDYNNLELIKEYNFQCGAFFYFSDTKVLTAGPGSIIVMDITSILNELSAEDNQFAPFKLSYNQIVVEPQYQTHLYNQVGEDLSGFIQNNKINREVLPNGIYFLTIQGANVNKVVKFFQAR